MWKNIITYNENIIRDEEYKNSCRITLEKFPEHYEITCGVYGVMVHTVYCGNDCHETYD